jgi:hypothetical protein
VYPEPQERPTRRLGYAALPLKNYPQEYTQNNPHGGLKMTKDDFKKKFIEKGLLTWEKADVIDFDHMYNHLNFSDSVVAELFEVSMGLVIKKRNELGIKIKEENYDTFLKHKKQGYLNWDEINYDSFDYLRNKCNFADSVVAELFDIPQKDVTAKRKELGVPIFGAVVDAILGESHYPSSYLDFADRGTFKSKITRP